AAQRPADLSSIVVALLPMLGDASALVRSETCLALGELVEGSRVESPDLVRALPELMMLSRDKDSSVRTNALSSIVTIAAKARPPLPSTSFLFQIFVHSLTDSDHAARLWAIRGLRKTASDKQSAARIIASCLSDSNVSVRIEALDALASFQHEALP